jgi:hypothetical protein
MEGIEEAMKTGDQGTKVYQFDKNMGSLRHAAELEGTGLHAHLQSLMERGVVSMPTQRAPPMKAGVGRPAGPSKVVFFLFFFSYLSLLPNLTSFHSVI